MNRKPYIGITGIVSYDDVATLRECAALVPPTHRLMAGVLVSAKTMRAEATANRRYPPFGHVNMLCASLAEAGCWPVVHFNTRSDLGGYLATLASVLPAMKGLQLNVVRPEVEEVAWVRRTRPDVEVIVQVNRGSLPEVSAGAIAEYLAPYAGLAAYALVDLSGGTGKPLDVELAAEVLHRVPWDELGIMPAVAGGFGPACAEPIAALRDALGFKAWMVAGLSVDAETRVRVPVANAIEGEHGQDALDREKALAYVRAAVDALRGRR